MKKILYSGLLAAYLVILIWLVLFKFSSDIWSVQRSINLIPFAAPKIVNGRINFEEIIYNCIFFVPFGLLLNVNFKKRRFLPKLLLILGFSVTAELTQFIFAIGASDITDVITNTVGGFLGLILYDLSNKYIKDEKLDRIIFSVGTILLVSFIIFRSMITIR
jgi:glycopeptide antibiotics resistance protein